MKRFVFCLALVAVFAMNASATTGSFTEPLAGAILSVDLNGGQSGETRPTEGWNGSTTAGEFDADAYGVVWSPWAGPDWSGGDNGQLPQNSEPVGQDTVSISKTFTFNGTPAPPDKINNIVGTTPIDPPITVTISADGNLSSYKTDWPMSSRDRDGADTNDGYMFRDFLFGYKSGGNTQGTNYLKVEFSGLTVGGEYTVALYAHDKTSASPDNSVTWTATPPPHQAGYTDSSGFLAPADVQTITWGSGTDLRAPVVFTLTADGDGKITVWGFGGDGITGHSDSGNTYLNGFQLVPVPEANNVHNVTADLWYPGIQEAIDEATDGDAIVVYPGTYYEVVDFNGMDISVSGSDPNDQAVVEATVIDGNGAERTVQFINYGSGSPIYENLLDGLTITGGVEGFYATNGIPVTLRNCIIRDNHIGVNNQSGGGTIKNCTFKNNDGVAIYTGNVGIEVRNCIIQDNNDGILFTYSGASLYDSLITDNSGSGVILIGFYADILNCTIANNGGDGILNVGSMNMEVTISNCILWNNLDDVNGFSATYSCIKDAFDANDPNYVGSIGDDPCFVGGGDYRLLSDSPCIDAGDNASAPLELIDDEYVPIMYDLDGFARFVDGDCDGSIIVDMGAYEFSHPYPAGDFDNQCNVDFQDFAVIAAAWLTEEGQDDYNPVCDIGIPSDGKIDMLDLEIFVENWLWSAGI